MPKILMLWAVPRSTSTAFEWMMRERRDRECFHEPFGEPWYQGEAPLWPRLQPDSLRTPGLTFDSVRQRLAQAAGKGEVFCKDFPHYIDHIWTDDLLDMFNHSFLIRDPLKVIASLLKHWPDVMLKETGFLEQRLLFDRICQREGTPPPVMDSDDLLANPHGMVKSYCEAVGIPFIESALSWQPGNRDEVSWWDGGSFHENLRSSDGLKPQPSKTVALEDLPPHGQALYETVTPHYQHLYQYRISAS